MLTFKCNVTLALRQRQHEKVPLPEVPQENSSWAEPTEPGASTHLYK